jgi:hypothetical protein
MSRRTLVRTAAVGVLVALVSGCSQSGGHHSASTPPSHKTVQTDAGVAGAARPLPPDFFGLNGANFIRGTNPTDPRFLSSLRALRPEAIRVFGGTTANYWDWRTGSLLRTVALPKDLATLPPAGMTLERWKAMLDEAGAAPIFDLNVVSSTLTDQLAMLRAAQSMGMAVHRVELGNELYQNARAVVDRYPSPNDYAQTAAQWSKAIKAAFPGVQISVVGALAQQGQPTPRKNAWNAAIRTQSADYDAVTLHLYFSSGAGSSQTVDEQEASKVIANTRDRLRRFDDVDLAAVPDTKTCWVSEYNLLDRDSLVPGTWLHGLVVAQTAVALASQPKVGMAVMHALVGNAALAAIFGGGGSGSTPTTAKNKKSIAASQRTGEPYALTAAGDAMAMVFTASRGATSAQALRFGTDGDVVGIVFTAGSVRRLLVANLSAAPASIRLGDLAASEYHLQELSAAPGVFVSGPGAVRRQSRTAQGPLVVEPWSLSVVD